MLYKDAFVMIETSETVSEFLHALRWCVAFS